MKKLFLLAVSTMLAVTTFSQKLKIHVDQIDFLFYQDSKCVNQILNKPVNTTYEIDLDNKKLNAFFKTKPNVLDVDIKVIENNGVYTITYTEKPSEPKYQPSEADTSLFDEINEINQYVTFTIDVTNNKIVWENSYNTSKYSFTSKNKCIFTNFNIKTLPSVKSVLL